MAKLDVEEWQTLITQRKITLINMIEHREND
jgi:hypothetical protein